MGEISSVVFPNLANTTIIMFWDDYSDNNSRRFRPHCDDRKYNDLPNILAWGLNRRRARIERSIHILYAWAEDMRLLKVDCNAELHAAS